MDLVKKHYHGFITICVVVILYYLGTSVFMCLDKVLFPTIPEIADVFVKNKGKLLNGFISSMGLLIPGLGLAVIVGVFVGMIIGMNKNVRLMVNPLLNALSPIPATLLTPYAIHLFSTFRQASIFVIFLGTLWPIMNATINGVMTIDKRILDNAETLNVHGHKRLFRVILPAASPMILSGFISSLRLAFVLLAVAEMFGANSGMGYFIQYYSDFVMFENVMVGFIFMGVVLVTILWIFDKIKLRLLHWTLNN